MTDNTDDVTDDISSTGGNPPKTGLSTGVEVIEGYLKSLPGSPGVYRMLNADGGVLYVGKAKSLKKRVVSYTRLKGQSNRIRRMVSETASMEFVTTHTEAESLLLEANLIKQLRPRYNILLRDDKSFPEIMVTGDHDFAQVLKHRGARKRRGDYFGPFASAGAVNETLDVLQKAFLLRTCSDSVFSGRTRPCLLFQIKRCAAPCVGRIGTGEYGDLVEQARSFLAGGSRKIQEALARQMEQASGAQHYEEAAIYRDRIAALTKIQARQDINVSGLDTADVIALHQAGGQSCIQVFFIRGGRNFGNRAYFPAHGRDEGEAEVLEAFIGQFYDSKTIPKRLLVSHRLPNQAVMAAALTVSAGRKVSVSVPVRGDRRHVIDHARRNAREALSRRLAESASQRRLLEGLADAMGLDSPPKRIEVYDNSHVSGSHSVGAMIVAGAEGFDKKSYRKFTIRGDKPGSGRAGGEGKPDTLGGEGKPDTLGGEGRPDTSGRRGGSGNLGKAKYAAGDDYAMMHEVLTRRFSRAMKEDPERAGDQWPDLVLIDGGKGQLGIAHDVLAELGIDDVVLAGISKGVDRNAGRETIHQRGKEPLELEPRDPVLFFLQRIRDEAHRFAIGAHRQKRSSKIKRSTLDEVPGIGPKRKKALLLHFGTAKAVGDAGCADLASVEGINTQTANKIYDWYHPDG